MTHNSQELSVNQPKFNSPWLTQRKQYSLAYFYLYLHNIKYDTGYSCGQHIGGFYWSVVSRDDSLGGRVTQHSGHQPYHQNTDQRS